MVLLLLTSQTVAHTLTGRVVKIADGDTITVLDARNDQHKIRLAAIDAPERGQPYGTVSGDQLGNLVFGRQGGGRLKVIMGGRDANLEQIRAGLAWHYKAHADEQNPLDRQIYASTELAARHKKLGLGQEPNPVPPWDWRKGVKDAASRQAAEPAVGSCSLRRSCGQMASCRDAMEYLRQCGSIGIDGDGDGVPCESMCR